MAGGAMGIVEPEITTERVALVVHRLAQGERATTKEIADWIGLTRFGAWEMLSRISRVLPITVVEGCWQYANMDMLQSYEEDGNHE